MRLGDDMKQAYYVIAIFIISFLVFTSIVFADGIKGLHKIYNTPIPCEIRRNFDSYIYTQKAYPDAKLAIVDGEKFKDIYDNKFLVIGLQDNSFGGLWVTILVEDKKLRVFRLWLYDIDDNEFDLRSITELSGQLNEEGIRQLTSVNYSRFWI
ncbi:MAG: hypothetical protein AB1755_04585 [Candidatus Omnitrophota bacterium]